MSGTSLMEQIIKKVGLQEDPRVKEKATELLRLLDLKSSKIVSTVGDYGKIAICIDLAATVLGTPFDVELCIKSSGLRKSTYVNHKRTFEKFLDLNKPVGINEICVRLDLKEISKKANEIMSVYKDSVDHNLSDVDLSHPQYHAMAVYQACKLEKKKISKSKIIACSHLKTAQWAKLEQQWDKLLQSSDFKSNNKKRHLTTDDPSPKKAKHKEQIKLSSKESDVEDYETWKRRMLAFAKLDITLSNMGVIDKENAVI